MTTLPDGRDIPFDDVGVLAPGGGTRGITRAGQAELTRQHFANTSGPTRALGMALGAAETIVPAVGSPKETLRTLAKAARDWFVKGDEMPGFASFGVAKNAVQQGFEMGTNAAAGDPHAQGAALATLGGAALAARSAVYGRAANAVSPRAAVDLTPSPKPLADPLDVPAFQRNTAPARQRFATDAEVRLHNLRQQYTNHTAETILPKPRTLPAVQTSTGRVFTGMEHGDAINKALAAGFTEDQIAFDGWKLPNGKFDPRNNFSEMGVEAFRRLQELERRASEGP